MASQALRSFQRALDVTGHNIANVNTPGYSRQVIDFEAMDPLAFWQGNAHNLGQGVNLGSINRIRDMFLEARRSTAQADLARTDTMSGFLRQVESVFLETGGTGVSDSLNKFFNAWSGLASSPNDPAMRLQVQLSGQTLADQVRGRYAELQSLKNQLSQQIDGTLSEIDQLTERIAELNGQIKQNAFNGAIPNDLMDQRDQALQQLSQLADVRTEMFEDGTMAVYMSNLTLVDTVGASPVPKTYDITQQSLTAAPSNYRISGGQLAGLFQAHNDVVSRQGSLDSLANTLRSSVNGIHTTGLNAQGNTGIQFFNDAAPQTGAIDFDLSLDIKGSPDAIAAGVSGAAGDGALALSLSGLRDTAQAGLGGKSLTRFFSDFVADIGSDASFFRTAVDTGGKIIEQIDAQIQSVGGVSLDDEMANMMRFQRSYQAAARALSVMDQVTEDLLGIIR
jgi:flagellar hook-associated protein 1 FlgK